MLLAYLPNAFVFKKIFKKILKGGQGFTPGNYIHMDYKPG